MTTTANPQEPASSLQPLLTEKSLSSALGGISERKFKELRAAGVIPDPLELGPRAPRWTYQDYLEILRRLPRRQVRHEPETLAEGRRARIESLKAGTTVDRL